MGDIRASEIHPGKKDFVNALFSFRGRINRGRFWGTLAPLLLISAASQIAIVANLGNVGDTTVAVLSLIGIAVFITITWIALATYVKRWHDLNKAGWFVLTLLIPFVNFAVLIYLGLAPGTIGSNRFGDPPNADADINHGGRETHGISVEEVYGKKMTPTFTDEKSSIDVKRETSGKLNLIIGGVALGVGIFIVAIDIVLYKEIVEWRNGFYAFYLGSIVTLLVCVSIRFESLFGYILVLVPAFFLEAYYIVVLYDESLYNAFIMEDLGNYLYPEKFPYVYSISVLVIGLSIFLKLNFFATGIKPVTGREISDEKVEETKSALEVDEKSETKSGTNEEESAVADVVAEPVDEDSQTSLPSQNESGSEGPVPPLELYSRAMDEISKGNAVEAKELLNQIIDSSKDVELTLKAKLHIQKIDQGPQRGIPIWLFAIPFFILVKVKNIRLTEEIYYGLIACVGIIVLIWSWKSWQNFAIDDAENKVTSASGWLWFIAFANIILGIVVHYDIFQPPFPVDWKFQVIFGIGFLAAAAITSWTRNMLSALALVLAIVAWGADTIIIAVEIVLAGFSVAPSAYIMLVMHLIILNSIVGALGGFNGIFKMRA